MARWRLRAEEDDSAMERYREVIANVRTYTESVEQGFIDGIWGVIKSEVAPKAEDWTDFHRAHKRRKAALADLDTSDALRTFGAVLAKRVAAPMARLPGRDARELSDAEVANLGRWIRATMPEVVELYIELMRVMASMCGRPSTGTWPGITALRPTGGRT